MSTGSLIQDQTADDNQIKFKKYSKDQAKMQFSINTFLQPKFQK